MDLSRPSRRFGAVARGVGVPAGGAATPAESRQRAGIAGGGGPYLLELVVAGKGPR